LRNLSTAALLASSQAFDNQGMQRTPIGQFIYDSLQAHAEWRARIKQAVRDGLVGDTPEHLAADAECPLGKWLASDLDPMYRDDSEFAIVKDAHHRFHQALSDIARLIQHGDSAGAIERIASGSQFAELSSTMNRELTRWLAKIEIMGHRAQSA